MNMQALNDEDVKKWMQELVAEAMMNESVYKYLTFESGMQMLANSNIQFTRGDTLNDNEDCDICKCDLSEQIKLLQKLNVSDETIMEMWQKRRKEISNFGICSLGTSADNDTLWKRYASSNWCKRENGICIKLNLRKLIDCLLSENKIFALTVHYVDSVKQSIPWGLYINNPMRFIYLLFSTKNKKKWEAEQELRLILPKNIDDKYFRCNIDKCCFEEVYYGKNMSVKQCEKLNAILDSTFPNINRIYRNRKWLC